MHVRSIGVLLVVAACPLLVGVNGCPAFEKICSTGEVAVLGDPGGSWCEQPQDGDRECADGEILVKVKKTGRDHCVENRYYDGWKQTVPTT